MTPRNAWQWGYLAGLSLGMWGAGLAVAIRPSLHYGTSMRWFSGAVAVVGLVVHVFVSLRRKPT